MPARYAHTWPRLGSWDGLLGPLPPVRCPGLEREKGWSSRKHTHGAGPSSPPTQGWAPPPPHSTGGDTKARGSDGASDPSEKLAKPGSGPGKQVFFGCLLFLFLFLLLFVNYCLYYCLFLFF